MNFVIQNISDNYCNQNNVVRSGKYFMIKTVQNHHNLYILFYQKGNILIMNTFQEKIELTDAELDTYNKLYGKQLTEKLINIDEYFYSQDETYGYKEYLVNKRILSYLTGKTFDYDEWRYFSETKNKLIKNDDYLDFLMVLATYPAYSVFLRKINNTYIVDKIKNNTEEFDKLEKLVRHLLETIVIDDNFQSIIPLSKVDLTNVKNILHYLHNYINKEMKTILYKTESDKRLDLDLEFIVYQYATGVAYFLAAYIYRYDIFNNVTQDIDLYELDLWKQWLSNQC